MQYQEFMRKFRQTQRAKSVTLTPSIRKKMTTLALVSELQGPKIEKGCIVSEPQFLSKTEVPAPAMLRDQRKGASAEAGLLRGGSCELPALD